MPKAFTVGQVLTASDVNNELNPYTAAHIPAAMAAGRYAFDLKGDGSITSNVAANIPFPAGRFTQPPLVTCNISTGTGNSSRLQARVYTVTSTTFSIFIWTTDGSKLSTGVVPVDWIAVQMTPAQAAG